MLERYTGDRFTSPPAWSDLGDGAPTVAAFAQLCAQALIEGGCRTDQLSDDAKGLLVAGRDRGIYEIRGNNKAYESPARFLTVYVELDETRRLRFRSIAEPRITIRFLDAFRDLCASGLMMHHLHREFSLTRAGFEYAATLAADELDEVLAYGEECGFD